MSLALLTLGLLCAPSAQAQAPGGWSVRDSANNGNPITADSSGYPLTGIPTGSASNTYPADMTAAALAPPYYDNYGQWVNNSQWLQAASGGPHSYDPNQLGVPYLYPPYGPGPLTTSIALNATANNFAADNSIYGSFNPTDLPFHTSQMYQDPSTCEPVNGSANGTVQGTLWAYWIWTGSSPAPVDHLNILLTTNVVASASLNYGNSGKTGGLIATAQASDGDPFNESASVGGVPRVIGHHLLRVPVSNGVAPVSLNGNVQGSASNSIPYGAFGSSYYTNYYGATNGPTTATSVAYVSGTAVIDSKDREVTVNCPAVDTSADGGSKYRDPALTGPVITNMRQSDGSLRGDTANYPGFGNGGTILDYTGSTAGLWSADSTYLWNSSLTGRSASGTWPNIYVFSVGEPFGPNVQKSDSISISMHDVGDGANAVGEYYMHFHDQYEPTSYPEDAAYPCKQTMQIDPDVPSWPTYSWHAELDPQTGTIDAIVGPASQASTFPYLGTEAQSWHIDAGLGIPIDPIDAHFGGGYDHDIVNHTSGVSVALPVGLLIGQKTWAVYRKDILRHKGHLDQYGIHGYTLTGVWCRDDNVSTEHGIYYPYADAATETAHDPAPDWNPGG